MAVGMFAGTITGVTTQWRTARTVTKTWTLSRLIDMKVTMNLWRAMKMKVVRTKMMMMMWKTIKKQKT